MTSTSITRGLMAGASLLLLSACASAPDEYAPLAQLEQRFETARLEQVPANAPVRFQEAERTLNQAQTRLGSAEEQELSYLTRLAGTQLDTAVAEAEARETREQRREILADQQRVMLQEREETLQQQQQSLAQQEEELALARQQLAEFEQRQTEGGLLVTLRDITFDLDSANLSPGDQERLAPLAGYLQQHPDRNVVIEGHTDASGGDEYNRELSQQRAEAVRNYLVARGVSAGRIQTVGRGEAVPVANNNSEAGRLQNRRIEVMIANPTG